MYSSAAILLIFLIVRFTAEKDPYTTLVSYENNQRLSAQVRDKQYHLLPFRLAGSPQYFIQAPLVDQFINVQVTVHWINNNSLLQNPDFDLTQKVRLVVEQESIETTPKRSILTKQFLTQTGFKLQLQAGRSYRWKIQSSGKILKLVEIALVKRAKNTVYITEQLKQMHKQEIQTLQAMKTTLLKAKQARVQRDSKSKQTKVSDLWAWMSGIQMMSILGVILLQVALFQKFMLPTSVV